MNTLTGHWAQGTSEHGTLTEGKALVLISSDQLLYIRKLYFYLYTKQPILLRRSTLPFNNVSVRLPWNLKTYAVDAWNNIKGLKIDQENEQIREVKLMCESMKHI